LSRAKKILSDFESRRVFNSEQTMTDGQTLLTDYLNTGSEAAFRELVSRYLNLVYSTAVRLLGGDARMAEDVAQIVFIDLARAAKSLGGEVKLGGWLHRHTCYVAAKTLRGERRRLARERQAVEMNALPDHAKGRLNEVAPILDEAINQLRAADRTAVLLRFYEQLDFCSVGRALGTSEAAAQKRVTRALERLHVLLKRRGVILSATALSTALACEAVTAAPVGLAASISGTAVASAAKGTGSLITILKLMAATKLKTSSVATIIVASIVAPLFVQHAAQARLNEVDTTWQQQSNQLARIAEENLRLADVLAKKNAQSLPDSQFGELLRLRGEVGNLKNQVQELVSATSAPPKTPEDQLTSLKKLYASRVSQLKEWLDANPSEKIPEFQNLSDDEWTEAADNLGEGDFTNAVSTLRDNAQMSVLGRLMSALRKYAKANNGQFPADLAQLKPYFKTPIDDEVLQRYEILPARSLVPELRPAGEDWVITQVAPVNPALDIRMAFGVSNSSGARQEITNRWTLVH
jgi:RNA polymerase sigma factor (sigma-70 family)